MNLNHTKKYGREIRKWLIKVFAFAATIQKDKLARRACPVCGSFESRIFANNGYLDYEQCVQCSLIYMNPTLPEDIIDNGFQGDDELLMEYFSIIKKYKTVSQGKPDPLEDNKLRDIYILKSSGKLLDVGCSVGDFLHKAKHFYEVEGLEVNPNTAAIAEQHFKVHKHFLGELELKPEYDIVTLHQVLYGVPKPIELLRDIHKILRCDGIIYVNTPNADSYAVRLFQGKSSHLYGYTTQNVFNHRSLSKLAELTGFRLKSFRTEWIDIYLTDLLEFYAHPDLFIHKKNSQIEDYEEKISHEDELHRSLNLDLDMHGNYMVAVLEKKS